MAYQYSRLKTSLVLVARRKNLLEKVAEKCLKEGAEKVLILQADLGNETQCSEVINRAIEELGKLNILILNHAIADDHFFM